MIGGDSSEPHMSVERSVTTIADRLQRLVAQLNAEQLQAYQHITSQLELQHTSDNRSNVDRLRAGGAVIVTGSGGTGKSYLIAALDVYCRSTSMDQYDPMLDEDESSMFGPVAKMAYTGGAAHGTKGRTLHSSLGLPMSFSRAEDFNVDVKTCASLQRNFKKVRLVVIDEFSFISAAMVYCISVYLRAARPDDSSVLDALIATDLSLSNSAAFGGMVVVMLGDPHQLRPVIGHGLLRCPTLQTYFPGMNKFEENGIDIWHSVKVVFILTRSMRQSDDPAFAEILDRGFCKPLDSDIDILNTRFTQDCSSLIRDKPQLLQAYGVHTLVDAANKVGSNFAAA